MKRRGSQLHKPVAEPKKAPFIEHLHELRKRLFYIALSIIAFASLAFYFQDQILAVLRYPAGKQVFVTTTPGGAFNFLFSICLATGFIASIPVIVYQLLRYMQPVIKQGFMRMITWSSIASGVLAAIGVVFAYFFGLPNSLRFLFGQSTGLGLQAMITIDSYASFVTMYLLGGALLFQIPLILIITNNIRPLKPSQLFKFERPFVVAAFIFGAIISPSPNIQDMLVLALPTILMYQVSMVIIWAVNRKHRRPKKVKRLLQKDAQAQATRLAKFREAQASWQRALQNAHNTPLHPMTSFSQQPAATAAGANVGAAAQITEMPAIQKPANSTSQPSVARSSVSGAARRPAIRRPYFNDVARRAQKR